jgi:hypothetical protein
MVQLIQDEHDASSAGSMASDSSFSTDDILPDLTPSRSQARPEERKETSADSSPAESQISDDEFNIQEDISITGFTIASSKRNADFHGLFPSIPEGDDLIKGLSHFKVVKYVLHIL